MLNKDITILLTYRCNAKCKMCSCHLNPTNVNDEITIDDLKRLPRVRQITLSGGEPFLRRDIEEVVEVLEKKAKRILIITNGSFPERVVQLCKKYHNLSVRVSVDGFEETNDTIRGISDGFQKCQRLISELKEIGVKDIGLSVTMQDLNRDEIIALYKKSVEKEIDFTLGIIANSFQYHKNDNEIECINQVSDILRKLEVFLLKSKKIKNWARAFFLYGSIQHMNTGKRLLRCNAGKDVIFIDPLGNVLPCQGTEKEIILGSVKKQNLKDIIALKESKRSISGLVNCNRCWSMCNVSNTIRKNTLIVFCWIVKEKIRMIKHDRV